MSKLTITIEEIKTKTREMLGLSEEDDLSYIDEEFVNAEVNCDKQNLTPESIPSPNYGTRISYGHRDPWGPTYEFYGGSPNWARSPSEACAGGRWWLAQSVWKHDNLNSYCNGSEQPAFRRIAMFTYDP